MKIRSSRVPTPAMLLATVAATVALFACGGGGDESADDGRSGPLNAGKGMPKAPPFVPLAEALPPEASEYDKHMQVARISWAHNDDITAPHWCANPGQGSNPNLGNRTVVPITELFDGFYFTGTVSVGQFVMKTPDGGYILFDTMNNATDVNNITIPQLQSAGIDPATLRGLVVTHGHGDHDGGALRLQTLYSTPSNPVTTVVGSADYTANKPYYATIQVDSTNPRVPQQLTINGATFTAMATPGHTPGTTSLILPVTYKGQQHKIAYWGGSGLPGSASGRLQYMQGAEAMYAQIKEQGADASINSHSWEDKGLDRIRAIQDQGGIENSNPMIQGTAKIQLSFATLRTCAAAQLSNVDATALNPVWRPTRTELYAVRPNANGVTTHVRARVSNYFNVISNGMVTFTTAEGASCTAMTDDEGIANCVIKTRGTGAGGPASVTATFQEMSGPVAVELSSFDTVHAANY
ncbi:MAG: MBL fold metallo-hydrolase [Burkholderiaceae bacterium]|nr:MBL fold metallo-hydrolase [Burkholderiaceae bacterium]